MSDSTSWIHFLKERVDMPNLPDIGDTVLKIALTAIIAAAVYFIVKKWISKFIKYAVGKTRSNWDDILYEQGFFKKTTYLILPVAAYIILSFISWEHKDILRRFVDIWLVIVMLFILTSLLTTIDRIYESYPISRNRPITFFIQLVKVFLYTITTITIISILVNKSPEHLIVGLSAFAAVLLLIFKDSILGFVAGLQLTANDMVRIGDWIVMSKNNANGTVLEINLYTVKVQNWDMTISTIPTYQMVSESFTNWRGMEESRGRRIMRSVNIDIHSVHFLSPDEIEGFRTSGFLKDYLESMMLKLTDVNKDKETLLDERKLTNIGVFRQYMELWIEANPYINNDMTHMVRQLQPGPTGMPIEIYCFSAKQEWLAYEKVQADIFDHVMAVIPQFNLKVFEYPSEFVGE